MSSRYVARKEDPDNLDAPGDPQRGCSLVWVLLALEGGLKSYHYSDSDQGQSGPALPLAPLHETH
jgi:hypothetical protein